MGANPTSLLLIALAAFVLVIAPVTSKSASSPEPHGPNVADAWHEPEAPARGQPVRVSVAFEDATNVTSVSLVYCRAENYACAPILAMAPAGNGTYAATIAWNGHFFRGVRHVGYNFTAKYLNGTETHSPRDHWPYRPSALPPYAGFYYFYKLPAEPAIVPLPGFATVLAAVGLGVLVRRRGP